MDRSIHWPLDLESRTQFRILESRIGKVPSLAAVVLLFRELGYGAQDDELGILRGPRLGLLKDALNGICTIEDLSMEGGFLVDNKDAVEGVPTGYFCPLFAQENRHLNREFVPIQKAGGIARAAKLKVKQAQAEAIQQAELLASARELFSKPDGEAMTVDEKNLALMLIKLLDNVLGRRGRTNAEFTPGLMADAFAATSRFEGEEIDAVTRHLMTLRDKQGVSLKTEDVLRDFEAYVGRVALAA
jgi:hypothetical protein